MDMDQAILEDAQFNKKNITYVWVDVKKAFDSVSHKWLELCLEHHGLPAKLTAFIKTIVKKWKITLDVTTENVKNQIWPNFFTSRHTTRGFILF